MQAATDSEYDQLRRENIATILSYGDAFMDLVCRDACDGLDVGRVRLAAVTIAWVKFFRIIPEFRILRLTFFGKSASKC